MGRRKKVLITGAAGTLGTALRRHLRDRYDFRLLCHSRIPGDLSEGEQVVVSDISSFASMVEAAAGMDAVIHLAIFKRWRGMTQAQVAQMTFDVDMRGTYNVFEAARINRVPAVVYASTNHVTGIYEKQGTCSHPDMPVRPDSIYGAGKAFGEALGRLYADLHGMRVYCLRVASFPGTEAPNLPYEPGYSRWLSPRDLAQLTWRCIEAEQVPFGIFYGVSRGGEKKWDLANAKALVGFEPEDDGVKRE